MPAASANSEVPIQGAPDPAGRCSACDTSGSTKIITMAQRITMVMTTGASSRLAPTAPATAMAAETPQTAPPTPSTAAKRRSSPIQRATRKMVMKVTMETDRGLQDGHRTGPDQKRQRQGGPEQDDPGLDVELHPEAGVEPARQQAQIGDRQPDEERDQRRLEIVPEGLRPLAGGEDHEAEQVEDQEGRHEVTRLVAERRQRHREGREPEGELRQIARPVRGDIGGQLADGRPLWRA